MKKLIIHTTATMILVLGFLFVIPAFGQNGEPPPPPGSHGATQNVPPGGGVPIGSGLVVMISLGAAYGGKKAYEAGTRLTE